VHDCFQFKIFSAKSRREQITFPLDDVCFVLDQHTLLDFYSLNSLKHQSASRHVNPLGHIILIPSKLVLTLTP